MGKAISTLIAEIAFYKKESAYKTFSDVGKRAMIMIIIKKGILGDTQTVTLGIRKVCKVIPKTKGGFERKQEGEEHNSKTPNKDCFNLTVDYN